MFDYYLITYIMTAKIYISKAGKGWDEVIIPEIYKRYSYDALIRVLHNFLDPTQYKGILITENPDIPGMIKKH